MSGVIILDPVTVGSGSVVDVYQAGRPVGANNPLWITGSLTSVAASDPLLQWRYDFSDSMAIYVGYSARNVSTGSAEWTIKKTVLDSSGNPTVTQWAVSSSWTSRADIQYS